MDLSKLSQLLLDLHVPAYRFKQITKNYFSGRFKSFEEMSDLPKDLRSTLSASLQFCSFSSSLLHQSPHTRKSLLTFADGYKIETVLMDYDGWITACISTQVGCPMNCAFCATGKMGFSRNLSGPEIVDQIIYWNQCLHPNYVGRIVFMGMGEPFLNWDNLMVALDIIQSKDCLNIGSRKISISTSGIVPKIKEFADLKTEINLAISLHSAVHQTRSRLMPVNNQYPLDELIDSARYYVNLTHRQLFFEYALIDSINDTDKEITALIKLIKSDKLFFLNIIPLNSIKNGPDPTNTIRIGEIQKILSNHNVNFTLRHSFGDPINAACGQLATSK